MRGESTDPAQVSFEALWAYPGGLEACVGAFWDHQGGSHASHAYSGALWAHPGGSKAFWGPLGSIQEVCRPSLRLPVGGLGGLFCEGILQIVYENATYQKCVYVIILSLLVNQGYIDLVGPESVALGQCKYIIILV